MSCWLEWLLTRTDPIIMEQVQQQLQEILQQQPAIGLVLILCLAFLEACPGIGLFISGALLLTTATIMYNLELVNPALIVALAMVAAFSADHLGFYLGRYIGPKFHHSNLAKNRAQAIAKGEDMIRRFGPFAIAIGRLIPAIRSLVPMLVGISGMSKRKFLLFDLIACSIWGLGLWGLMAGISELF